jgi:hypothetical protein
VSFAVTGGAAGFSICNPANTNPSGIFYHIWVVDQTSGSATLGQTVLNYGEVQWTGATFSLDTYAPSGIAVLPIGGGSVGGNLSVTGNLTVSGTFSAGSFSAPITGPVTDQGGQVYNVKAAPYGASGNGSTDDTAAITSAINAAATSSVRGVVFFPQGQYKISSPLPVISGVRYTGTSTANGYGPGGSVIKSSAGDLFTSTSPGTMGAEIDHLTLSSQSGGGHIFNFTELTVTLSSFHDLVLLQSNAAKSALYVTETTLNGGAFFGNTFANVWSQAAATNSVPLFFLKVATINQNLFQGGRVTMSATSTSPAFWFESTNGSGYVFDTEISQTTFEAVSGGAVEFLGADNCKIRESGIYDTGSYNGSAVAWVFGSSTAGLQSLLNEMDGVYGGNVSGAPTIINSSVGAVTGAATIIGSGYSLGSNSTAVVLSSSGINFNTNVATSKSYAFGVGTPGNYDGYFWLLQGGTTKVMQFDSGGNAHFSGAIYGNASSATTLFNPTTVAASNCGSLSGAAGCISVTVGGVTHYVPYW